MSKEEIIFYKIEKYIPNFNKFKIKIINHIQKNYFPLVYQCLYERIMPSNSDRFSTQEFKILIGNNYLKLLNDVYRTRLSSQAVPCILKKLQEIEDFNNYKAVLGLFAKCDVRKNKTGNEEINVNAFSLGTKVLHTYNPEENPILDSIVRKNLGINDPLDINLCMNFKKAMNIFIEKHEEYFSLDKYIDIKNEFKKFKLKMQFPKMKILDMALL